MSFSMELKSELASVKSKECCEKAMLAGAFQTASDVTISKEGIKINFQSKNLEVAKKIYAIVNDLYKVNVTVLAKKQLRLNKEDVYIISIDDNDHEIINDIHLFDNKDSLYEDCCKRSYIKGAFLSNGSINNPEKSSYHLEIQTFDINKAEKLKNLLNEYNLKAKTTKNKRGYICYVKEAEKISDFLRLVGAVKKLIDFEDERINRDFNNSINRIINCEIANEKKAIEASNKQLEYISIVENKMFGELKDTLKEAIFLRKEYPDKTLSELSEVSGDHFSKPISKSALNHRFRMIKEIAEKYESK